MIDADIDHIAETLRRAIIQQSVEYTAYRPHIISGEESLDAIEVDGCLDLRAMARAVVNATKSG